MVDILLFDDNDLLNYSIEWSVVMHNSVDELRDHDTLISVYSYCKLLLSTYLHNSIISFG